MLGAECTDLCLAVSIHTETSLEMEKPDMVTLCLHLGGPSVSSGD